MLGDIDRPPDGSFQDLHGTTYRRVHNAILSDIVNGTFVPGARLKIADLCRRYGLSPMPIREALQQLQGEGIVVIEPNKGASVRTIDRSFVADIYDIRGALYSIVYRDLIAAADAALDEELAAIQKHFDQLLEEGDRAGCHVQNRLLHAAIEARCKNHEVAALIARYANLTSSLRDVFGYNTARLREISYEHWQIIDAVRARDVAGAIAAAQYHVQRALANMSGHFGDRE